MKIWLTVLGWGVLEIPASAHAVLFVPVGVAPGESYQLAFVTAAGTPAKSGLL